MPKTIEHEKVTYTYRCDYCHQEFSSYKAARKCETSHSEKEIEELKEKDMRIREAEREAWSREYEGTGRDCS